MFDIPAEQRGWFTQVLTRAVAATALLFAGNSSDARQYATLRQRGEHSSSIQPALFELDPPWASSTAETLPLSGDLSAEGTTYRAPLPGNRTLEVFRGVESGLYRQLAEGRIGSYLRSAPRVRRNRRLRAPSNEVLRLGSDGTVLEANGIDNLAWPATRSGGLTGDTECQQLKSCLQPARQAGQLGERQTPAFGCRTDRTQRQVDYRRFLTVHYHHPHAA